MDKNEIAGVLREIGVLLELKGENRFKSVAYANAARMLETLQEDLGALIHEKRLGEVKGIGEGLTEKITALFTTGRLPYHEELKADFPSGLLDCLRVPGLGPRKVKTLWEKLQVDSLGDLRMGCERGMVAKLEGFGEKTQAKILEGLANLEKYRGQFLHAEALQAATLILQSLKDCRAVQRVETAGSLRRRKEVVRDLDFVVSTREAGRVMRLFTSLPEVEKVTGRGDTKSSVILKSGIQADVRCVSEEEFPFALAYFTGSKEHNVAMRQRAISQGKKLNEYGLFEIGTGSERPISCKDETALYRTLGLDYVEPELREDMGEIAAAEKGELPTLVSQRDIRGTFHCHTSWSDGLHSIEEMANAAMNLGWEYLGIADHSKSSAVANGLNEKRLAAQIKEIEKLNAKFKAAGANFRLFAGSEVDILGDGSLDFPDDLLARLDFVVASIHQGFTYDEARQTARVLRAVANKHVAMLGHPTGRLLLSREPYKVDLGAVIDAAARAKTIIELNCTPSRMELDWRWWKGAREKGVMCSINPDAHSTGELSQVSWGVAVARKGWLRPADILNTRPLEDVIRHLKRKK
ncbi:MAG: DNA polymerase/3'-5' exonuclease PolX [Verrucomicrobia bacterium]|nr:DNA polymerase/3'-5' exonuclease PolX [Verrucomicrobiota bacterium]